MNDSKSGFSIGDKFVYISKYYGVTLGVVEKIQKVKSLEFGGVTILRYFINDHYDSKEIHHYTSVMDTQEYEKLILNFNKIQTQKHNTK